MKSLLRFFAILLFIILVSPTNTAWGQDVHFEVTHSLDWTKGELTSLISFQLAAAGIRLPSGRFLAEEILREAYPLLLRPHILSLRVDSNATVKTLIDRGELLLEDLDIICKEAERVPPSLSADLSRMSGRYTVLMEKVSALLTRHIRAVESERPLIPIISADYTGIIIIADTELPIHGRREEALVEPCLFPKIWDTNMNLIFERNMFQPSSQTGNLMVRYTARESIFRPSPSGLEGEFAALVGPNPLRLIAREVFGITPTDPVIDRDDALRILSTENNRRLLQEGRVLLVLNEAQLIRNN